MTFCLVKKRDLISLRGAGKVSEQISIVNHHTGFGRETSDAI